MFTETKRYSIRNMSKEEVAKIVIEWAEKEGWNPGLYDVEAFYETDPKGFFVGLLGNEPISCISAVAYDDNFGFVGFYIVKPEYRGRGYGLKIWNEAILHLKPQNIGLDGVLAQQSNYMKSGFKLAYRNIRFEGKAENNNYKDKNIVRLTESSFKDLLTYDSKLFPVPRVNFLKSWLKQPGSTSFAAIENVMIKGYGMIRKCRKGYKIGPLFADNEHIAEKLFISLRSSIEEGVPFYLDTPEPNPDAVILAEKHGMKRVFETVRMYTKQQPDINLKQVFGVTTFELG